MREENLAFLDSWVNAASRNDYEALRELMADDIELHLGGQNPFSGTYRGKDDVVDVMRRIDAVTGASDRFLGLVDKMASDDHAYVRVRKSIAGGGRTLDYTRNAFYTIEGGMMREVRLIDDEQYEMDALLSEVAVTAAAR